MVRSHCRRIQWDFKLNIIDIIIQTLDFRHIVYQMIKIKRFERTALIVLNHSDCTPRIHYEYMGTSVLRIR